MPDLLSHLASGYLLQPRYKSRAWMGLFLIGIVLPDLVTRPFYILAPQLYWYVLPLHTPVGMVFLCLLISGFFIAEQRNRVFSVLLGGCIAHQALDLIQKHSHAGYRLLFPFDWNFYEFGWVWPEDTIYLAPFLILFAGAIIGWRHLQAKKSMKATQ